MLEARKLPGAAGLVALVLVGGAAAAYVLWPAETAREPPDRLRSATIEIVTAHGSRSFDVELALTPSEQAQGLMYRTKLEDTRGMLFLHPKPAEIRMWMRNTYIPLDMVFIRADGVVHRIAAMAEPLSETIVASQGEVTAVLELNGGAASRLGLAAGDRVKHPHFRPVRP